MLAQQRQEQILADIRSRGAVRVADLVVSLDVSDMTIRRDIADLARRGLVRRVHGGAVDVHHATHEPGFGAKRELATAEKAAIAREAVTLVTPGSAIALSAGTTTHLLARLLAADRTLRPLTVVTNSLPAAEALHHPEDRDLTVVLTGGTRTPSDALVGPVATRAIAALRVDILFLGVHAVHAEEEDVHPQRGDGPGGDGADQGVRRRARPAGEDDRQVAILRVVQRLGRGQGVGHDGQRAQGAVGGQQPRQQMCGGPCGERDGRPRCDQGDRLAGDRRLLGGGELALGPEARLVGRVMDVDRATVHPADQPMSGQVGDVAPDRHVRDVETDHEVRDPDGASATDVREDLLLPLLRQHAEQYSYTHLTLPTNREV